MADPVAVWALGVSIVSAIVSIGALIVQKSTSSKQTKLQVDMKNLAYGQQEFQLTSQISAARKNMDNVFFQMEQVRPNFPQNDPRFGEMGVKLHKTATEDYLNVYDSACGAYRDGKVDKERFKKQFAKEIRQIVENPEYTDYFPPHHSSYQNILQVYAEWNRH